MIFFTFLGTVPIPVQLGKIALFSLQLGKIAPLNFYENTGWKCHGPIPRTIKIIIFKFKLAIGCFSWCKCFYVMSNFEDWEKIIHFWNFFGSIGKKHILFGFGNDSCKGGRFYSGKNHCNPILFNGARESDTLSHHYMVL